jgi:hypothetical protein
VTSFGAREGAERGSFEMQSAVENRGNAWASGLHDDTKARRQLIRILRTSLALPSRGLNVESASEA